MQTRFALTVAALHRLSAMAARNQSSVNELVELTGRAQPNGLRSLRLLAKRGIVKLVREGREVRPEPLPRRITIDVSTGSLEPAAPRQLGQDSRTRSQ